MKYQIWIKHVEEHKILNKPVIIEGLETAKVVTDIDVRDLKYEEITQ